MIGTTHVAGRGYRDKISLLCVITLVHAFAEFLPFVGAAADMFVCNRPSHLIKIQLSELSSALSTSKSAFSVTLWSTYKALESDDGLEHTTTTTSRSPTHD